MKILIPFFLFFYIGLVSLSAQPLSIGLLKYDGGGDWYANPTSLANLIKFCNKNIHTNISSQPVVVSPSSPDLFKLPFVHLTGHGNISFSPQEVTNIRKYLESGGFLHIDDNYGLDKYIRREMKKVFPNQEFQELPFDFELFHSRYNFTQGLPKIHEHDNKPPQAFGLFLNKRLVCLYTYECDLGDGWESPEVHNDPQEIRELALKMGANIISYVFSYYQ